MSEGSRKSGKTKEERSFFRVEDEIYLEFRVLTELPPTGAKAATAARKDFPAIDPHSELSVINAQIHPLLELAKNSDPAVARCLEAINKKIDLLARAMNKKTEATKVMKPNRKVNLSAGGVAFNVAAQLLPGTPVEVRMAALTSNLFITAFGVVAYCEKDIKEVDQPFRVGINFPTLPVAERQALFAHVLGRHTEKIRSSKYSGNDEAEK